MLKFSIEPPSPRLAVALREKIDAKTKPLGALGKLEDLALKIGVIQDSLSPELRNPTIVVFAGDHGVAEEGVSAYPASVTAQMVRNFLAGGAAINVFCESNGLRLQVVDAGVKSDLPEHPLFVSAKLGYGTENFRHRDAMSPELCLAAVRAGAVIVDKLHRQGTNLVGFGEMGIGNSSSAAMLMHRWCDLPLAECVGRGTGLEPAQLARKARVLSEAACRHPLPLSPLATLSAFGGFEIAMLAGAYLKAAECRMTILVDGFISTVALLAAEKIQCGALDYCLFTHRSPERGHRLLLEYLGAEPLLDLRLRLGEGTGAALAYPLVRAAVCFLNRMASFSEAGVSGRDA